MAAKKKEVQEAAEKKQTVRRKKQASAGQMQEFKEAVEKVIKDAKPFDLCIVFQKGDNIDMIAKQLTGRSYMAFKVCEYSGVSYHNVKPGTVLKWPMR